MFKYMNLFKETTIKVLKYLAENAEKELYQREIAKKAGVSIGGTNQALKELVEYNFITAEKRGRMFFYSINLDNVVAREFKILFNVIKLIPLIDDLKKHSSEIILFGSAASGEDTSESDIDLFIKTTNKNKKRCRKLVSSFESKIKRELSEVVVDSEDYTRLKKESKPFIERIGKGKKLWQE